MGLKLRDYQEEFVAAVESGVRRGVRRQLAVSPTGSGKTICFAEIVRRRADKPTLILAHRDELLQQAREKLVSVAPELSMSTGLVKAGSNDVGAPVVIASIQTLARESRLHQLPKHFGTVIVDEGHHAVADSYQRVLDYLDANRTIVLWPLGADRYDALMITVEVDAEARRYRPKRETFRFLGRGLDLGYAMCAAEETIRSYGSRLLADKKAAWREDPVSPGQRRALGRLRLPVPETKGEAADLLDEAILSDRLARIEAKLLEIEAPEAVAA